MTEVMEAPPIQANPYQMRFADQTIVSIYPTRQEKQMNAPRGFKPYVLDAAPRGKWTTLKVSNSGQWLQDMSSVDESNPTPGLRFVETPAWDEAGELVRQWTSNTLGGRGRPGIGLLPFGVFPPAPGERASEAFLRVIAELNAVQTQFAQYYVKDANDKHVKGEMKNVTDTHRIMGRWLLGDSVERLPWYGNTAYTDTKQCVACSKQIISTALKCEHCHENFIDWHLKYGTEPENDPAVLSALARVRAKSSAPVPEPELAPIDYGAPLPKVEIVATPIEAVEEEDGDLIPASLADEIDEQADAKKK